MARGVLVAGHSSGGGVSLVSGCVVVLLCPKSLDADLSVRAGPSSTDIAEESPTTAKTAFKSTSNKARESHSSFELCGKRPYNDKAGPSRKRFASEKATKSLFTSSLENECDIHILKQSTQPKTSVSAVLARYDTLVDMCHLIRVRSKKTWYTASSYVRAWVRWVRLFCPCGVCKQRQDGIAALAQLRHMIRRRGFMRFVTELASLSQAFRKQHDYTVSVLKFMETYELLGEGSPLEVTSEVKWAPLRHLVESGECPAWLLHKALQDQIREEGSLRPFFSFLTAAAEIYKALPEHLLRHLEDEVDPESFVLQHRAPPMDDLIESKGEVLTDPSLRSLVQLRSAYFNKLGLSVADKRFLTSCLSYVGSLRYYKQWSGPETFVLDLANALGVHLEVADETAERLGSAEYWHALPLLTQLISVDRLPTSTRLKVECKDLVEFLNERKGQPVFTQNLDLLWCLAEALYELLLSHEKLKAAIDTKESLVKEFADPENLLLEEDPCLTTPQLPNGRELVVPSADEHLPGPWYIWAALRETVMPEGTSHRDMEALVDVQLRPQLDLSDEVMNFISALASVMWPRDWFCENNVSSYDKLLEYFHNPTHLTGDHGGLDIFDFADANHEKAADLAIWLKQGMCNSVTLATAMTSASLYNLLIRAAGIFPHVADSLTQRKLVLTPCLIPNFPEACKRVNDPTLAAFRAHAARFVEADLDFRKKLRVLVSIRSFNKLNKVEQVLLDLAAALCVSLPGEPGHSPYWISAETFHSIMSKQPKWQQLFASPPSPPKPTRSTKDVRSLFDLSCLRLKTLFDNVCLNQGCDGVDHSEKFGRLLGFAQYVLEATE
eukprot:Blabericola_migrator_1__3453@NODE_2019_length_3412_cov_14_225710_g1282_i0_p1_GENE_NODE_2019_length_3412_cov_14_225710_g1282_i0NODE_2019_length_3412_cov_14_225710_g1282_i0_p1_ORF_typecomplete_len837_score97_55IGR/PF09597_10/5_1IGR/PF09597_10/1_6e02Glyco_hydro_99/PF16317_5/1_4Glyco_hydro_99/PF16317_5/4_5e02_NODE_2019_length_3412_cov_14_225710_g1282_i07273237